MAEGNPVVWVKNPNAYRVVADQNGTRLEPSKSMAARVVGTVFFLVMASITTLFSLGIYNEAQSVDEPSSVSGCWEWQTEVVVGGNPPYCYDGPVRSVIDSLEVSEDQHIRERAEDLETGSTYTEEYRWEDVGDSIVYGFIGDGRYYCVRFVPEFALPEDWVPADIDDSFEYPDWCKSPVEGQDDRVYEEGAHPYDDVWMYEAGDVGEMSSFLHVHKTSETGYMGRHYIAKSSIEQERAEWEAEGELGLVSLFCTVPMTLLFLFAADQRPRVFVINQQAKTITRRRSGRYPSFSRTWSDVDFSATTVVRSVRRKADTSSSGFDESYVSTSNHPGLNIVISYGPFQRCSCSSKTGATSMFTARSSVISWMRWALSSKPSRITGVMNKPRCMHDPRWTTSQIPTAVSLSGTIIRRISSSAGTTNPTLISSRNTLKPSMTLNSCWSRTATVR